MSGERFARAAGKHLSDFLQDATSGLAAGAVRINADYSGTDLPTTYTFPGTTAKRQPRLPYVGLSYEDREVVERAQGYQRYRYYFTVVIAVGREHTKGDPAIEEELQQSLDWLLTETFDEEEKWQGHTLGGRVSDAYLAATGGGLVRLEEFGEKRAVMMGGMVRVTLREAQTYPA